jgi:hypothetical protein
MAEVVQIDIPGIGLVDARNAASEKTLSEILKILQDWEKKHLKSGGGGGGGGNDPPADPQGGLPGEKKPGTMRKSLTAMTSKIKLVIGTFVVLGDESTRAVSNLANLGDSLESVANLFSSFPLVGPMFGAVASASERVVRSFNDATQSGATFGGSLNSFAGSASEAGMTLSEFGSLIRSNGQGMLAFGGTVEAGAKRFASVSKQLRATGSDLYALGFSTQEINKGLATFGEMQRLQGMQGRKSNAELVAGASRYLKNLDALAKITGEERSAKEAEMKALMQSAQFQASMAGLSEEVRDSFLMTVGQLPKGMQKFAEDIMATGTATTDENQKLLAMMPKSAALLTEFNAKQQRGEAITLEERNRLNNLMKQEGGAALQSIKQAGAANAELAPLVNSLASTYQINTDAVKEATEEQKAAKAATDKVNEAVNKMRERIAAVSNAFTMFLVNSGALDQLMRVFELLVGVVQKFAIPIINLMMGAITIAVDVISKLAGIVLPILTEAFGFLTSGLTGMMNVVDKNVNPAFTFFGEVIQTVGNIIDQYVKPALLNLAGFIIADVFPVLKFLGETIMFIAENVIWPAFEMIGSIIRDYVYPAFAAVAGFIADNLFPILAMLGAGFAGYYAVLAAKKIAEIYATAQTWLLGGAATGAAKGLGAAAKAAWAAALPFIKIVAPIVALVGLFAYLYKTGWSFGDVLEAIGDNLKRFAIEYVDVWLSIAEKIARFFGGGDAIKSMREKLDLERQELKEREKARDQRRADRTQERGFQNRQNVVDQMSLKLGEKQLGQQQDQIRAAEKEKELNLGDPYALLKGLAEKESSEFVNSTTPAAPKSGGTAAGAEGARRTIETEAEQRRAQEQRAREEQQRQQQQQQQQQQPTTPPATAPSTQEVLIASIDRLNTNMERMVAQQSRSNTLLTNQVRATENVAGAVSGDLFGALGA